jgi:hypothetical protein
MPQAQESELNNEIARLSRDLMETERSREEHLTLIRAKNDELRRDLRLFDRQISSLKDNLRQVINGQMPLLKG